MTPQLTCPSLIPRINDKAGIFSEVPIQDLGSAGCQPAFVGSLPTKFSSGKLPALPGKRRVRFEISTEILTRSIWSCACRGETRSGDFEIAVFN